MTDKKVLLTEAVGGVLAADKATPGKYRVAILKGNVWGSSGYYSEALVQRDGPRVFPEGTQMYLDHPTETEKYDRPARSVRDLAGKIVSTPEWNATEGQLEADVQFYKQYHDMLGEMMEDIGISIRARGVAEYGTVEGREGPIITSLVSADSVDVVTKAGAGGAILHATESATWQVSDEREDTVAETTVNADSLKDLTEAVTALAEAFKQDREERKAELEEAAKDKGPTPLEIALAVAESGLPKSYMARTIAAVEAGADVKQAVADSKAELKTVLEEVAKDSAPAIGAPGNAGATTVTASYGEVDVSEARIDALLKKIVKVGA